jgi:hypothetical protein
MIRVSCYIDGFNVYHAIDDMSRATRGVDKSSEMGRSSQADGYFH